MRHAILGLLAATLALGGASLARGDQPETAAREGGRSAASRALFNGRDLSGWKPRHADGKNGWKVVEGVLTNTPPSTDLVTEERFGDFRLKLEYRIPAGSNSGIYLRGRYEIQINDDYGKAVGKHINGSVYGRIAPVENASRPAGEWQTVDATLVGRRVTVLLNGKKVIDNQMIDGPTGAALDDREAEPGPLMLQGDHGVVAFRNIAITPL